jgi:hypothetical protein
VCVKSGVSPERVRIVRSIESVLSFTVHVIVIAEVEVVPSTESSASRRSDRDRRRKGDKPAASDPMLQGGSGMGLGEALFQR